METDCQTFQRQVHSGVRYLAKMFGGPTAGLSIPFFFLLLSSTRYLSSRRDYYTSLHYLFTFNTIFMTYRPNVNGPCHCLQYQKFRLSSPVQVQSGHFLRTLDARFFFRIFTNFYEFKLIFSLLLNDICQRVLYVTVTWLSRLCDYSHSSNLPTSQRPIDLATKTTTIKIRYREGSHGKNGP